MLAVFFFSISEVGTGAKGGPVGTALIKRQPREKGGGAGYTWFSTCPAMKKETQCEYQLPVHSLLLPVVLAVT